MFLRKKHLSPSGVNKGSQIALAAEVIGHGLSRELSTPFVSNFIHIHSDHTQ